MSAVVVLCPHDMETTSMIINIHIPILTIHLSADVIAFLLALIAAS